MAEHERVLVVGEDVSRIGGTFACTRGQMERYGPERAVGRRRMTTIDLPAPERPGNKGVLVGRKRPLVRREVWAIRVRLEMAGDPRELALFNLAIAGKPRACDLLALVVERAPSRP